METYQDNRKRMIDDINNWLINYSQEIKNGAKRNDLGAAHHAENNIRDLLNSVMGENYRLENANFEKQGTPGFDLIDQSHKLIVQVSIDDSAAKIRDSVQKTKTYLGNDAQNWHLQCFFLVYTTGVGTKAKDLKNTGLNFEPTRDILDFSWLVKQAENLSIESLSHFYSVCSSMFASERMGTSTAMERTAHDIGHYYGGNPFKYGSGSTEYFGRQDCLEKLEGFLEHSASYKVMWWAVTGLGGTGKSRLVSEIAEIKKDSWDYEIIQDDAELEINYLNNLLSGHNKNLILAIDTEIENFRNLAVWMKKSNNSASVKNKKNVRIIFLRRETSDLEDELPPKWSVSLLAKDPFVMDYLYQKKFLKLNKMERDDVFRIMQSYLERVYPDFSQVSSDMLRLVDDQEKMALLDRPLFSLFLADAYAHNECPYNWDEERILQYTYKREKQILYEKYSQAFQIEPFDFPQVFELLENSYAAATMMNNTDNMDMRRFVEELSKASKSDDDQIIARMQNYGFIKNQKLEPIEPDIVGEYFVLQRYMSMQAVYVNWDFHARFFRDLYRILNTRYTDVVNEILAYDTAGALEMTYAEGLFELTKEDVPLEVSQEAMSYLGRRVPDTGVALGAGYMAMLLARGLFNIILKQTDQASLTDQTEIISNLLMIERLYRNNPSIRFADVYARSLMAANEGQWYSFVLPELVRLAEKGKSDQNWEELNELIRKYVIYLQKVDTTYTKAQLSSFNAYM